MYSAFYIFLREEKQEETAMNFIKGHAEVLQDEVIRN